MITVNKNFTNWYYKEYSDYSLIAPIKYKDQILEYCSKEKREECSNILYLEEGFKIRSFNMDYLQYVDNPIVINNNLDSIFTSTLVITKPLYNNITKYEKEYNFSSNQGLIFKDYSTILSDKYKDLVWNILKITIFVIGIILTLFIVNIYYIELYFELNKYELLSKWIVGDSNFLINKKIFYDYLISLLIILLIYTINDVYFGYSYSLYIYLYSLVTYVLILFCMYKYCTFKTKYFFRKR